MDPYRLLLDQANRERQDGGSDLFPNRSSSRRNRVDDLEDLMMMEAIRLSLAAEEDRKRKEDKEVKKEDKKKAKEAKKEAKQMEKLAKRNGGHADSLYRAGTNDSASTWASTSMARSTSNLGPQPAIPEEHMQGKGKAPVQDFAGFNPLFEPTSTLNMELRDQGNTHSGSPSPPATGMSSIEDPQRHLEQSRAFLHPTSTTPIPTPSPRSPHFRHFSNASSAASSFVDSAPGSLRADSNFPSVNASGLDVASGGASVDATPHSGTPAAGTPGLEPMFNFRSLAAMIGDEETKARESEHIENAAPASKAEEELKEPSPTGSPAAGVDGNRSRGDSGESSSSGPPPIYVEHPPTENSADRDLITPAPRPVVHHDVKKEFGRVDVLDQGHVHEATQ